MKKAFTMAEAIIVMTILGIIATIMITNLKPAEFRDKALLVASKKLLREIDEATNQILLNNSYNGSMTMLYEPDSTNIFQLKDNCEHAATLYKKYLVKTRKNHKNVIYQNRNIWLMGDGSDSLVFQKAFMLKDGAFFGISCNTGKERTCFPGESQLIQTQKTTLARIIYDVNGEEEPNLPCKDIFAIPIGEYGIEYDN